MTGVAICFHIKVSVFENGSGVIDKKYILSEISQISPYLGTEGFTMSCLVRAVAHLVGWW
jgi:hypothetical protein